MSVKSNVNKFGLVLLCLCFLIFQFFLVIHFMVFYESTIL